MADLEKANQRVVVQEAVHLVLDGNEEVVGFIRRDPVSKKALVYIAKEANCDDIATKIIK